MGLARVTQVEDTVGVKTLGPETGMSEGLEATVNVVGKNSRDVSREYDESGNGGSDGISLCEQLKALAFTLTWEL